MWHENSWKWLFTGIFLAYCASQDQVLATIHPLPGLASAVESVRGSYRTAAASAHAQKASLDWAHSNGGQAQLSTCSQHGKNNFRQVYQENGTFHRGKLVNMFIKATLSSELVIWRVESSCQRRENHLSVILPFKWLLTTVIIISAFEVNQWEDYYCATLIWVNVIIFKIWKQKEFHSKLFSH